MAAASWTCRPPLRSVRVHAVLRGQPHTAADLTRLRIQLRVALGNSGLPVDAEDGERLLLAFEELVSNGLRHGRPPVDVCVGAGVTGWLLEVSDVATDRPPVPAIDRDAAEGGMGLGLVARLSRANGWIVEGDRKVVWAHIPYGQTPGPVLVDRLRRARARARALASHAVGTKLRVAATLDRLGAEADEAGKSEVAQLLRDAAGRARAEAERRRRMGLAVRRPVRR